MSDELPESITMTPSQGATFYEVRRLLDLQSQEDRLLLLAYLTAAFCVHCGVALSPGERCNCTNDE